MLLFRSFRMLITLAKPNNWCMRVHEHTRLPALAGNRPGLCRKPCVRPCWKLRAMLGEGGRSCSCV